MSSEQASIDLVGSEVQQRYKRPFDLILLALIHLALAPVWILLWTLIPLLIWLGDRGPVFFVQERVGMGGRTFNIFKFRTMVEGAEDQTGPVWASGDDPRVTLIGGILRRTALDELPQILNVWLGHMSLVGPRPERPELHAQIVANHPEFAQRLVGRPGIAGSAQVHGHYNLSPAQKLEYDLEYFRSMSPMLDMKLLLHAVGLGLLGKVDRRHGDSDPTSL